MPPIIVMLINLLRHYVATSQGQRWNRLWVTTDTCYNVITVNAKMTMLTLHLRPVFFNSQTCLWLKTIWTRYDYNLTIMKSPNSATDTIYPHIKFWWYRTMFNFYPPFLCCVLAAILKMADILKILKTQNCSSNGDLSLSQILCLYHYPVRSYQH